MGVSGVSFWQLLIILIIVMLLFGTNRLRNLGSDLGEAIKGFRSAMAEGEKDNEKPAATPKPSEKVINDESPRNKV